jgi:hypothetical protein
MKSDPFTVRQIFQDRRQYRVPFYQRAYVWTKGNQWGRLWEDIRDKADALLQGDDPVAHFMGAVVLEQQQKPGLFGVERLHIIDGQQRLTTLQFVLTALQYILRDFAQPALLPVVDGCLVNGNPDTMEEKDVERFKLWPTFRDRDQFVSGMTATTIEELRDRFPENFTQTKRLKMVGVRHPPTLEAIIYFRESMLEWANDTKDFDLPSRVTALANAVLTKLKIVCILLDKEDDAQVIFETLNGHGAELHATDLIRNFIFMRAGDDAADLYKNVWSQFETATWSEKQSRGRLNRPRLEWFVQSAVQAETGEEIDIGRLYAGYRRFVDMDAKLHGAATQLALLNRYGEYYKALVTGKGNEPIAVFGRRISPWDASTVHPVSLRVSASGLSVDAQNEMFGCIESYLVRRAICGLSRKNYNKVFAQHLKRLMEVELDPKAFRAALSEPTGEASRWPRDEEFHHHWLEAAIYPGRLDAAKLRTLFHRLETAMRSEKSEELVPLSMDVLDIDHMLPQSWYAYWPLNDGSSVSNQEAQAVKPLQFSVTGNDDRTTAILERERHISRMGNLTLAQYGVNRGMQNHGFFEKQKAFFDHSHLQLNRVFTNGTVWNEVAIQTRGEMLFKFAREIWGAPAMAT